MFMDGAFHRLFASSPTLPTSRQFSQVDELTCSRSASWHGYFHRKNVGWPVTEALNVAPFLAHHRTRSLEWKLIPSTQRIKSAKYYHSKFGHRVCSSNLVGVCRLRNVSDDSGILNGHEKRTIRGRYKRKALPFQKGGLSNLEFEILKFMESSEKPFAFPTKSELLKAGRADLVDAILATGGWLVAGWDVELAGAEKVQTRKALRSESISTQILGKFVESPKSSTSADNSMHKAMLGTSGSNQDTSNVISGFKEPEPSYPLTTKLQEEEASNLSNIGTESQVNTSLGELLRTADRKRRWEEVSKLFGLSSFKRKPENDGKTVIKDHPGSKEEGAYISTSVSKASASVAADKSFIHLKNAPDSFLGKTDILPSKQTTGGNQSIDTSVKSRKKKKRSKFVEDRSAEIKVNQAFDRINEKMNRSDWVPMVKSSSHENSDGQQHEDNPVPISSIIRALESELISTLNMLQAGRRELTHNDTKKQMDDSALSEFEKTSDALEFRETDLMRTRGELRTTRAQLTALKGKLALDLMEAQKGIEDKDKRLDEAMDILKTMRTVRIVWPNPASEVFLVGSFDGWTRQIKLQKSNAGVFVTALQLYPGRYEIKFIVDGLWRVDPDRPIVCTDGFENNVLTI